jgi:FkbM family methyltransferase
MVFEFKNWLSLLPIFLKKTACEKSIIRLRNPRIELLVRDRMDVWSIKETFIDAFYTRYGCQVKEGWQVMDIGAGIGDYSIYVAVENPTAIVYAFEPFPNSFELLEKNLSNNNIQNVHPYPIAIWSQAGDIFLDLSNGEPLKITSSNEGPVSEFSEGVTVHSITLNDFISEKQIHRIDLLKLDCEGAEYEILLEAPKMTLKKIDRIIMEYHDVNDDLKHDKLIRFLQNEGYQVKTYPNFVHDDIGYLYAVRH